MWLPGTHQHSSGPHSYLLLLLLWVWLLLWLCLALITPSALRQHRCTVGHIGHSWLWEAAWHCLTLILEAHWTVRVNMLRLVILGVCKVRLNLNPRECIVKECGTTTFYYW